MNITQLTVWYTEFKFVNPRNFMEVSLAFGSKTQGLARLCNRGPSNWAFNTSVRLRGLRSRRFFVWLKTWHLGAFRKQDTYGDPKLWLSRSRRCSWREAWLEKHLATCEPVKLKLLPSLLVKDVAQDNKNVFLTLRLMLRTEIMKSASQTQHVLNRK